MREFMFGVVRDVVCFSQAEFRVDVEFGVGVQVVPDPARPDTAHGFDPGPGGQRVFGGID